MKKIVSVLARGAVWSSALNLTKSTLGGGVLTLQYAAKLNGIPMLLILLLIGAILTYVSINMLALACQVTGKSGYDEIAHSLYGRGMAIAVGVAMVSNCFGAAVSYVQAISKATAWIPLHPYWRTLVISTFPLAPLGCIYRINSLRYFSLAGVIGVTLLAFTTVYALLRSGVADTITQDPAVLWRIDPTGNMVKAFSTITFSYVCHYNIPHIYSELQVKEPQTMKKVALASLTLSTSVYLTAAICGYLAFGTDMASDVLSCLQPYVNAGDLFVKTAVIGCVLSICVAHSLHVYPIRQTAEYFALQMNDKFQGSKILVISLGIVVVYLSWVVAIFGPKLQTTIELVGASAASAIAYIFPALFAVKLKLDKGVKASDIAALWLPYLVLFMGTAAGVGGTYYAVLDFFH